MKVRYEVLVAGVIKYTIIPDREWSAQRERCGLLSALDDAARNVCYVLVIYGIDLVEIASYIRLNGYLIFLKNGRKSIHFILFIPMRMFQYGLKVANT